MSHRHIDTLAQEEWFQRPWIMLGTGPSLDTFNADEWPGHNIAAIYDAFYAARDCDILFYPDSWVKDTLPYLENGEAASARYIGARAINAQFVHHFHRYDNVVMWDYDCDRTNYGVRMFEDRQPYPCSNTSSFVVLWLGTMGVREIRMWGIDGGRGVSRHVSQKYIDTNEKSLTWDPDKENGGVYGHAGGFNINLIKM